MQCQDVDRVVGLGRFRVHDQADMLQETAQLVERFQGDDQFLEIFQFARRICILAGLPHASVAAFVEDDSRQFIRRHVIHQTAPTAEVFQKFAEAVAGSRLQVVAVNHRLGCPCQGGVHTAGGLMQQLNSRVAQSTPGRIHDAFERQVVVRLRDNPQIGDSIPYLGPFKKPGSADQAVGNAECQKAFLELAGLKRCAD